MGQWIVGNWKMNGSVAQVRQVAPEVASFAAARRLKAQIALCPPAMLVPAMAEALEGGFVTLGAQDISAHDKGAYTGEISAGMLKEFGCRYAIVGHSERRAMHFESDGLVAAKAKAALAAGIIPIICVGETLEEREHGKALEVVVGQMQASVPQGTDPAKFLLAYEPVWAIGSGKVATRADIEEVHGLLAAELPGAQVLYGGSVKPGNAAEILAIPHVSGLLVGGASLTAEEFCGILAAAK